MKAIISKLKQRIKPMSPPLRIALGLVLLMLGILGIILPVLSASLLIPISLLVLSRDFKWAKRGLAVLKLWMRRTRNKMKNRKRAKRIATKSALGAARQYPGR